MVFSLLRLVRLVRWAGLAGFTGLLGANAAWAAAVLDLSAVPALLPEKKQAALAFPEPRSFLLTMEVSFRSFDADRPGSPPLMESQAWQRLRIEALPAKPEEAPGMLRQALSFDHFTTKAKMAMPGSAKAFENKQDFTPALSGRKLTIVSREGQFERVEGLAAFRESLEKGRDPVQRTTLLTMFGEDNFPKAAAAYAQAPFCVDGLEKKKPGAKWSGERKVGGAPVPFRCEFQGWAEAKSQQVMVVAVTMPKAKTQGKQPNGTPAVMESKGEGTLYLVAGSGEYLFQSKQEIFAEPLPAEIRRNKRENKPTPRNRSEMDASHHVTPI